MITLYSKPGCPPCAKTKARLKQLGVEFEERDVTADPEALTYLKDTLGYAGVPVVAVDEFTHWVGWDPDRLDALV